jgi:hypothetical protein
MYNGTMEKPRLTVKEVDTIISLRRKGYTLSEIRKIVPKGKATISKYVQGILPHKKYQAILDSKQNGTRTKRQAEADWKTSYDLITNKLGSITERDFILVAGMLYWGEGTKTNELNIINSDPVLIRIFLKGLYGLGVPKERIKISLRLYGDLDKEKAIQYWLNCLNLSKSNLISINYLYGKKEGKLPYGMCRLRVTRSSLYFKQLISMINLFKTLP